MLKRWKMVTQPTQPPHLRSSYGTLVRQFFNEDNHTGQSQPYFYATVEEVAFCEFHTGAVFQEC